MQSFGYLCTFLFPLGKGPWILKDPLFLIILRFVFSLRRHQGFGVLSVILANHAVKLLTSLFQDLQVEALHKVRGLYSGNQHVDGLLHFWVS